MNYYLEKLTWEKVSKVFILNSHQTIRTNQPRLCCYLDNYCLCCVYFVSCQVKFAQFLKNVELESLSTRADVSIVKVFVLMWENATPYLIPLCVPLKEYKQEISRL